MTNPSERVRVLPVELPDGSKILAEVSAPAAGGDVGAAGRLLRLADIRSDIGRISRFVSAAVTDALPDPPRRYAVEFGLKLAVESTGLTTMLAKAGGEATLLVRLEWEREPNAAPVDPTRGP